MAISRLVIGQTTGSAPASPPVSSTISSAERYAPSLEAYLVSLLGFALAAEAWNSGHAQRYAVDDTVVIGCRLSPAQWIWTPNPTLSALTTASFIGQLHLERETIPAHAGGPLQLGPIGPLLHTMGQALGTNFFEQNVESIKRRHGDNPSGWPPVWNFARVIRNAMSHGGKINFANPNAQTVSWKGLGYGPADNGRHVLHSDLWPGDLFDLLIEMDAEF